MNERDIPDSIGTIARQSAAAAELDSSPLQAEFHMALVVVPEYSACIDCRPASSFPFATADCISSNADLDAST